jgi:hypothetical protein
VVASALGVLALAGASDVVLAVGVRLVAAALVALLAAIVLGWSVLVPVSALLVGAAYVTHLSADDLALDARAPLLAAGLLLAAELGYWSIEARQRVRAERGEDLRRLGILALLALASVAAGAAILAAADLARAGGLAVDLLGAAAALGTLLVVSVLALRPARAGAR